MSQGKVCSAMQSFWPCRVRPITGSYRLAIELRMLCCQVSAVERQLVMELLALFTPEAVAGQARLPKARRAAGPAAEQVLMDTLGQPSSAGAHEPGQSLVKLAALTQLTGLYSSLEAAHQQQLVQVMLQLTPSRRGCASCMCNPKGAPSMHALPDT